MLLTLLILIPTLITLAMLNGQPAVKVAHRVYLPMLFLVPIYVDFPLGGFKVNALSFVCLLIAAAGWRAWSQTINLNVMDCCVAAYAVSTFLADANAHTIKLGCYALYYGLATWVGPYLIGRLLIEQHGLRRLAVRTILLCLFAVSILNITEYFKDINLFQQVVMKLTHIHIYGQGGQHRWGFARTTGPYGQAIIAGLTFATGLFLTIWMVGTKSELGSRRLSFLRGPRGRLYLVLVILMGLFMTQSRGPWLGCAFGLIVTAVGFARNKKQAAIAAIVVLGTALLVTSSALDEYTSVDVTKTTDRDQLNAAYRRDLFTTYAPVIAEGGVLGLGTPGFHNGWFGYVQNQPSIDNEYLRVAVQQGYLGEAIFLLLMVLANLHLIRLCITLRAREDYLFAYCLLGAMVSVCFTITTVALLDPMIQITFHLMGWSQSLRPTKSFESQTSVARVQQYEFERVFV